MDKNKKDWQIIREMGLAKYLFKEGVLFGIIYGLIATGVLLVVDLLVSKNDFNNDTIIKSIAAFLLVAVANIVSALILWFINESKLKRQSK